jgi:hypothetical protein
MIGVPNIVLPAGCCLRTCAAHLILEEVLPVLHLLGPSSGDFSEALEVLLGPEAASLSATTITRLLKIWQEEYQICRTRSLTGKEYAHVSAYLMWWLIVPGISRDTYEPLF